MKKTIFTLFVLSVFVLQFRLNAQEKAHIEYWNNGAIATEGTVNNKGIRTGVWKWYYDNGDVQIEGLYDEKGEKKGVWTYYYKGKNIQKTEVFSGSGEVVAYYPDGKLQYRYTVVDNSREGAF